MWELTKTCEVKSLTFMPRCIQCSHHQKPRTELSVLLLLRSEIAKIFASILHLGSQFWNKQIEYFSWHWKYQQSTNICLCFILDTELCITLKIFADLSKHLPVFLLGTENGMGWWVTKSQKVKKVTKKWGKKNSARGRGGTGGGGGGYRGAPYKKMG